MKSLKTCFAVVAFSVVAASQAAVLHYSGDFNDVNGLAAEENTQVTAAMVYDEFTVTGAGWNITNFNALMLTSTNPSAVKYEIRSGVSTGNGGTLLATDSVAVNRTAVGSSFGYTTYNYEIAAPMTLSAGSYWLGLSVIGDTTGRNFWGTTTGANGVGSLGTAYLNSAQFSANFVPVTDSAFQNGPNFSFSVEGEPVPEPATMLALAPAALAMLRRKKKSA